jgi:predicted dienelactone hydrolase
LSAAASRARDGCAEPAGGYAIVGHSFGGYTAFAEAQALVNLGAGAEEIGDDRVWAVIPWAPWNAYGVLTGGTAALDIPTLLLTGDRDDTISLAQVRDLWTPITHTPRWFGVFPDAGHFSFSPIACELGLVGDGCGDDYLDLDTFTELVNQSSLAFLESARGLDGAIDQLPLESADIVWESVQ